MKQFKKGDKVRRMKNTGNFKDIVEDGVYTVESSFNILYLKGYDYGVNSEYFELVSEEFNLEKDSWFIRTPTTEISELVQEWLFEKGFHWSGEKDNTVAKHTKENIITNHFGKQGKKLAWTSDYLFDASNRHEIKFTFKNVIDNVEFPVKLTPEQHEIAKLEKTIQAAQERINQLKS